MLWVRGVALEQHSQIPAVPCPELGLASAWFIGPGIFLAACAELSEVLNVGFSDPGLAQQSPGDFWWPAQGE